jgi:isopentenyl-diphosphate delta-isomerase
MNEEYVVLVDVQDKELGTMEKMQAHLEGKLHRAVSVLIFNSQKQMLLQKRADSKYHSAGLWTNTCCSHPRKGETPMDAATRRLYEEMGINCKLLSAFNFIYAVKLDKGLTEHEFDYVFAGICDDVPLPDPTEVSEYKYLKMDTIEAEIKQNPGQFTEWFKIIWKKIKPQNEHAPEG